MKHTNNTKALFIIVNAGFSEEVIQISRESGARGATIINARGEGAHHELFMGITMDSEKEMILCIVDESTSEKIMTAIKEKSGIETSAHSVCFTMPINKMIGVSTSESKEKK